MTETKTFKRSEWLKMLVVLNPTTERATVRVDHAGKMWEWMAGGKRVTARAFKR